eukprot:3011317-Amphidinium_carterae.1
MPSSRGADLLAPEKVHKQKLLDTPLDDLSVQDCCHHCVKAYPLLRDVDDNPRLPCKLEVHQRQQTQFLGADHGDVMFRNFKVPRDDFDTAVHNARQVLERNKARDVDERWHLSVRCKKCNREISSISASDTKERLYLDLRQYIAHDRSLPLLYAPPQADLPADAEVVCRHAQRLPQSVITSDTLLPLIKASLQPGGHLRETLTRKQSKMDEDQKHLTYLRVGVGLKDLGEITAVLELWPVGHSSPKHHHGGCAGSVRVLSGVLDVKLYDSIISETPMSWKNGDAGLELGDDVYDTLQLKEGDTTWMNRANWYVHEVAAKERPENRFGFAISLHVYKSCETEFGMVKGGVLKLGSPENDYFWNIDLAEDDERVRETKANIPAFMVSLLRQPGPAMPATGQPAPAHQPEPMEEVVETFTGTAETTDDDLRGMSPASRVQLAGCTQVTDAGVEHVARKCAAKLRDIDLQGCGKITDAGLKELAGKCHMLTSLGLHGC